MIENSSSTFLELPLEILTLIIGPLHSTNIAFVHPLLMKLNVSLIMEQKRYENCQELLCEHFFNVLALESETATLRKWPQLLSLDEERYYLQYHRLRKRIIHYVNVGQETNLSDKQLLQLFWTTLKEENTKKIVARIGDTAVDINTLDLSNLNLDFLPTEPLMPYTSLEELNLQNNNLHHIPHGMPFPLLKTLNIANNEVSILTYNIALPTLTLLRVEKNPLKYISMSLRNREFYNLNLRGPRLPALKRARGGDEHYLNVDYSCHKKHG